MIVEARNTNRACCVEQPFPSPGQQQLQRKRASEACSVGGRPRRRAGVASVMRRSTLSVTPTPPMGAPPAGGHSAWSRPS